MSLVDLLAEPPDRKRADACRIQQILENLEEADREALRVALDDSRYIAGFIRAQLCEVGIFVADSTIRRHRRGECACGPR